MNARRIIRHLARELWFKNFVLPNYTPPGWWECDLFVITNSGYFTEYEVKVSRADFFADTHKARDLPITTEQWLKLRRSQEAAKATGLPVPERPVERKHHLLYQGDIRGPAKFWYVVPDGLIQADECPHWAGLIFVKDRAGNEFRSAAWLSFTRQRAAPFIHRVKGATALRPTALETCYYRFHRAWRDDNG